MASDNLRGIVLMVLSMAFFAVEDMFLKFSAQSLPTFPGEGGQSAASAASSSAAFAADNAARSATLLAQNPSGPCSVALAQNAAFAASSAAAAAAAAGKFCLKREEIDDERKEQD